MAVDHPHDGAAMNNGIRSLPRYQEGGDVSSRRQQNWREEKDPSSEKLRVVPAFLSQWARDIAGAQIRDRLGWIPGAETVGNWVGAEDITSQDLTRAEYEALQETVLRAMQRSDYEGSVDYPDYGFSVTDPEHSTNKAFEKVFGGYGIDYDYPGWDYKGIRGNPEAIDQLVEASKGWDTVSNPDAPLGTLAGAGKGPAVGPTGTGLIDLSPETYKFARGAAGLVPRMTDPSASMMQMLGRMNITQDPDTGDYYANDTYNWNHGFYDKHGRNFNPLNRDDWGLLKESLGAGEDVYDKARVLSEYFGSRSNDTDDPQGSHVSINLGQLDEDNRWANARPGDGNLGSQYAHLMPQLDEAHQEAASQFAARSGEEEDEEGTSMLASAIDWLQERRGHKPTEDPFQVYPPTKSVPQLASVATGPTEKDLMIRAAQQKEEARDEQAREIADMMQRAGADFLPPNNPRQR